MLLCCLSNCPYGRLYVPKLLVVITFGQANVKPNKLEYQMYHNLMTEVHLLDHLKRFAIQVRISHN